MTIEQTGNAGIALARKEFEEGGKVLRTDYLTW